MTRSTRRARAVLFDLDGTLLDTAPDMAEALNVLRREQGIGPLPYEQIRQFVSNGAAALVRLGFPTAREVELETLRMRYVEIYGASVAVHTRPFEGVAESLARLEKAAIPWGVVTNKPGWLTEPLLRELALQERAGVVVSGDSLPERKPHPAPLLHAAAGLGVPPGECIYVGDAERDVLAARAAGMQVFVALFGYIPPAERPREWPANGWLDTPSALCELLDSIITSSA